MINLTPSNNGIPVINESHGFSRKRKPEVQGGREQGEPLSGAVLGSSSSHQVLVHPKTPPEIESAKKAFTKDLVNSVNAFTYSIQKHFENGIVQQLKGRIAQLEKEQGSLVSEKQELIEQVSNFQDKYKTAYDLNQQLQQFAKERSEELSNSRREGEELAISLKDLKDKNQELLEKCKSDADAYQKLQEKCKAKVALSRKLERENTKLSEENKKFKKAEARRQKAALKSQEEQAAKCSSFLNILVNAADGNQPKSHESSSSSSSHQLEDSNLDGAVAPTTRETQGSSFDEANQTFSDNGELLNGEHSTSINGYDHTGTYKNGKWDGVGMLTKDSVTATGEFAKNLLNSSTEVHLESTNGWKLKVAMKKGRLDGKCRMTCPDGSIYFGSYKDFMRHGIATITRPKGTKFQVSFHRDVSQVAIDPGIDCMAIRSFEECPFKAFLEGARLTFLTA